MKIRIIRFSTWTAIGFTLLAISLLTIGMNSKGDTGLHLTIWGVQLMLFTSVIILITALLHVGSRRIIARVGQEIRRMKLAEATMPITCSVASAASVEEQDSEPEKTGADKDYDDLNPIEMMNAHFNWDTSEYEARGLGGLYNPPYDFTEGK